MSKLQVSIADCFSCQFDLIESLLNSTFGDRISIHAFSYTKENPIFSDNLPDVFCNYIDFKEYGYNLHDYTNYILGYCEQGKMDILFVGKNTSVFEGMRSNFERIGVTLITGTYGLDTKDQINNKYLFAQYCEQVGLPFIPTYLFNSVEELKEKMADADLNCSYVAQDGSPKFCVKPSTGIYASGFFVLDDDASMFKQLSEQYVASTENFIKAYSEYVTKPEYVLMPHIKGAECSLDIICDKGEYLDAIQRIKGDSTQLIQRPKVEQLVQTAKLIVKDLNLDGLINIQFIQHSDDVWLPLEVNSRPSGGYVFTHHLGFSLFNNLIAHKLGLADVEYSEIESVKVRPTTSSMRVK
ncbi:ATP-grasp domain-containing protein [Acinetobacter sp. P1(2025)]|uniref:ATP-grasp domain-containing protein n=1 Tax=Acinetobacter sp. P1(2025) TaxID=3446120 RepID=UPI003F52BB70